MRTTEDHIQVNENDHVYEILYRYLNPEVSLPEPELRRVKDIPAGVKIWKERENCARECKKIQLAPPSNCLRVGLE